MKELFLVIFFFFAALIVVFVSIAFGWYLVWWLLVERFRFVRELFQIKEKLPPLTNEAGRSGKGDRLNVQTNSTVCHKRTSPDQNDSEEENKENQAFPDDGHSLSSDRSSSIELFEYSPTIKLADKPRPNPAHKLHLD